MCPLPLLKYHCTFYFFSDFFAVVTSQIANNLILKGEIGHQSDCVIFHKATR